MNVNPPLLSTWTWDAEPSDNYRVMKPISNPPQLQEFAWLCDDVYHEPVTAGSIYRESNGKECYKSFLNTGAAKLEHEL